MGILSEKAASVAGPIAAADPTGITGVMRIAVTGAAQSFALPAAAADPQKKSSMGGRFIRLCFVGVNGQLAQGLGTAPTIVNNQVSVIGAGSAGAGATFFDGVPEHFDLDHRATHIGFIGASAAGFLEYYVSDKPGRV